ncbi:AraC family transcriptional regulator [Streptomyces sp. LHD-70]|uniref:AraC family transcriptional regulator n=1 Tax=Streptomyces sp. LHD-70 TaxID=3072140 RepID=UPI00280E426B|nr:AraC family transcriptional regulator [Streptomyces sp. LHD-70]MDQ8706149.1 AraC family transcriptional regulator [Streptomyces sp. LHD-70]
MNRGTKDLGQAAVPVGALSTLPQIMREFGHDPWELLESFGITQDSFAHPLRPLPMRVNGRILEAAGAATGCDHLGLLLGQRATLDNTGPLRFLVLNAHSVRDAVDALLRFSPIWYPGLTAGLTVEDDYAALTLSIDRVFPGSEQILTAFLVANVKILEMVLGRTWRPTTVHIAHREPASTTPYRRFFRATVLFDQPRHEVWFPKELLVHERAGADQKLERFLYDHLVELQGRDQPDLVVQVRKTIQNLLATGSCSVENVAALFGIHRYTLHRHLARHGITFEALLDETRRDVARHLLTDTELPMADIAHLLGYSNQGNFTRAFKRWHHQSPGRWRKQQGGEATASPR